MRGDPSRFEIGGVEMDVLYDGVFGLPTENLFANAPAGALEDLIDRGKLPGDSFELTMSPMLLRSGGSTLLVDAGFGPGTETSGRLVRGLDRAGFEPGDIDTVLLSHAHTDHVGGLKDPSGAPVFPQAEIALAKEEWDHWRPDAAAGDQNPFTRLTRRVLAQFEDQVRLLEDGEQVMSDVRVRLVPGHTPGHLLIVIGRSGERILLLNDLVLHPLHLSHPDWYAAADHDGPQNVAARRAVLPEAEGTLCHVYHFPYPAVGRVRRVQGGWRWEPVEETSTER